MADCARTESHSDRIAALTGLRAVAALLVLGTHAAFATGFLNRGYLGHIGARLEVGVAIFFALSGLLLFRPWVRAAATGSAPPKTAVYGRRRVRRILPAYLVTVVLTFSVYTLFAPGPNPGQTWSGLLRYLTLTQIYTDNYLMTYLHPGLSQMWSLAVEVAFYAVLPLLAYLLLTVLCGRRWRPGRLLAGVGVLAAIGPVWLLAVHATDWLPNAAGMWLPAHLPWFAGGMALTVLQTMGVRVRAALAVPVAVLAFLAVATPIGGHIVGPDSPWQPLVKSGLYAVVATLALAPLALGDQGWYHRLLSSRPMVWLGEISYEIFLLHVVVMALAMNLVLQWPLFTGSLPGLYLTTLAITIPLAMVLRLLTDPNAISADRGQTSARKAGTSNASARPRWDTASFSCGLSSAADLSAPAGRKIGS